MMKKEPLLLPHKSSNYNVITLYPLIIFRVEHSTTKGTKNENY